MIVRIVGPVILAIVLIVLWTSRAESTDPSLNGTITLWDGREIPAQPKIPKLREQHELRVEWLREKHRQLLPMMRKHEIGMWIIPEGTFDPDPLTRYVAPARSFSHGVTHIFVDAGDDGLKAFSNYRYPNETYVEFFEIIPEEYNEKLAEIYGTYQPETIGLAFDGGRGHNSSLTYDAFQYISLALGSKAREHFVPARDLIEDFVDTRLPEEWAYYKNMVVATDRLAQRALSNEVITPGETTTADLKWWFDQEMASWGVGAKPWFTTNTNIQRFNPDSGKIERVAGASGFDSPDDRPYQRGDLITIDCGVSYLGFKTDIQRVAYVLPEGEVDVPAGLKEALSNRNTVVKAYRAARPGYTGRQAAAAIEKELNDAGFQYSLGSHSIGYHGHALGPGIRSTSGEYNPQRENQSGLRPNSYMAVEGETRTKIAEWNNQEVTISYEEQGYLTAEGYRFFSPLQDTWYLIR
jgi:Xaa-Pro aminopeptidase